jgi:hypothetical protein
MISNFGGYQNGRRYTRGAVLMLFDVGHQDANTRDKADPQRRARTMLQFGGLHG